MNPVSTTLYEVLAATKNVRIISSMCQITWATTQPTPMDIVVTIDGRTLIFRIANPVTATPYYVVIFPGDDWETSSAMSTDQTPSLNRPFLFEGRSVKVQIRVTWATTQPTPLVCRVKYAKIP